MKTNNVNFYRASCLLLLYILLWACTPDHVVNIADVFSQKGFDRSEQITVHGTVIKNADPQEEMYRFFDLMYATKPSVKRTKLRPYCYLLEDSTGSLWIVTTTKKPPRVGVHQTVQGQLFPLSKAPVPIGGVNRIVKIGEWQYVLPPEVDADFALVE